METICIIITKILDVGKSFKVFGKELSQIPCLHDFYFPQNIDISLNDFKSNENYRKWYYECRDKYSHYYENNDLEREIIIVHKLDDKDPNKSDKIITQKQWENFVLKYLIEKEKEKFPCRRSIINGGSNVIKYKKDNDCHVFVLPVFERDVNKLLESTKSKFGYIEDFINIVNELKSSINISEDIARIKINLAFHASDFSDLEKEDIGYCIYKYKPEDSKKYPNTDVWFYSHVDNEFVRYIRGLSTHTAKDLFNVETYRLPDDIDKCLIKEGNKKVKEELQIQIDKIAKNE